MGSLYMSLLLFGSVGKGRWRSAKASLTHKKCKNQSVCAFNFSKDDNDDDQIDAAMVLFELHNPPGVPSHGTPVVGDRINSKFIDDGQTIRETHNQRQPNRNIDQSMVFAAKATCFHPGNDDAIRLLLI